MKTSLWQEGSVPALAVIKLKPQKHTSSSHQPRFVAALPRLNSPSNLKLSPVTAQQEEKLGEHQGKLLAGSSGPPSGFSSAPVP